jgi:hypothetical protein
MRGTEGYSSWMHEQFAEKEGKRREKKEGEKEGEKRAERAKISEEK